MEKITVYNLLTLASFSIGENAFINFTCTLYGKYIIKLSIAMRDRFEAEEHLLVFKIPQFFRSYLSIDFTIL